MCYAGVCMDGLAHRLATDLEGNFGELVAAEQDLVYGVALRALGRPAAAQDIAQEAFMRAYRALSRYSAERIEELRLRPWLARIALNLARNELRARRPIEPLDESTDPAAAADDGPVRLAERREDVQRWRRLLAGLPERYRLAIGLRHVDGLSYAELSELLDRPLGSVKSDVHRGVALLRAAYDADERLIAQKEAI
jgi:RNA polymerase sigma-70 factor (ECF subfamily)